MFNKIIILLCLFNFNLTTAKNSDDFSKFIGKYDGYVFDLNKGEPNKNVKFRIELQQNYNLSIKVKNNNKWMNYIQQTLKPLKTKLSKYNNFDYYFNVASPNKKWVQVFFSIPPKSLHYQGIFITLINDNSKKLSFEIYKHGGNPKEKNLSTAMDKPKVIIKQKVTKHANRQKNVVIQQHLKNVQINLKSFHRSNDFIINTTTKVNSSTNTSDWQNYLTDIRREYASLRVGTNASIKKINSAISEAKSAHCQKTQQTLEEIKSKLFTAKKNFQLSEGLTQDIILANSKDVNRLSTDAIQSGNLAFDAILAAQKLIIYVEELRPCYKTSSARNLVNKTNNAISTQSYYVEAPITKDPSGRTNLVGVGLSLGSNGKHKKGLHINNSVRGWAAYKAGMHEGMTLLKINDKKVGASTLRGRELLVGKNGSKVKVLFINASGKEKEFILYRGEGGKPVDLSISTRSKDKSPQTSTSLSTKLPPFYGEYTGDNFFRLMGRTLYDVAIKTLINDRGYHLKRSLCTPDGDCWYTSKKGINLKFYKGRLTIISFRYSEVKKLGQFNGVVPNELPLGKSIMELSNITPDWEYEKTRNHYIWSFRKHKILVSVYSQISSAIINTVVLDGSNVDWSKYYVQFE